MSKKTIIVFSGDYDKVMAAFIIANGALAMDDEVAMFFTFWGISALRKPKAPTGIAAGKSLLQKAFSSMMAKGPERLGLSKMNFLGAGPALMKKVMKAENAMTVAQLIDSARELGVKMTVCGMSMDILGIKMEELIDGLELSGVAAMLGDAEESDVTLFI